MNERLNDDNLSCEKYCWSKDEKWILVFGLRHTCIFIIIKVLSNLHISLIFYTCFTYEKIKNKIILRYIHRLLWKVFLWYRGFPRFGQAKFPNGGSVLGSSQFTLLPQLTLTTTLLLKSGQNWLVNNHLVSLI